MEDKRKHEVLLDSIRGCLFGGAFGDALGYPVEFMNYDKIKYEYGEDGITEFDLRNSEKALISDDTQMTLFTANGILYGHTRSCLRGIAGPLSGYVFKAYEQWYQTQINASYLNKTSSEFWIFNIDEFHNSRAPGNSCMSAIANSNGLGTILNPVNDSKGCGGAMRVAPIGCFSAAGHLGDEYDASMESANVAALTHGHPLGYISAAFVGCMVCLIIKNKIIDDNHSLYSIVNMTLNVIRTQFGDNQYFNELRDIINKAVNLSKSTIDDIDAITSIGEGWVAEEAIAIALYSVLKHSSDFNKAIICAVNHSGDSDSTGSIAGNILGAHIGLSAIDPTSDRVLQIEAYNIIFEIAQDLVDGCQMTEYGTYNDVKWNAKYITGKYGK